MADDFETFGKSYKSRKRNLKNADFINMFSDLFNSINYKVAIFLFILGILIFSDIFIESFLPLFKGSVDGDTPTTKGTTIQLVALTFGYIIIDLLVTGEII